MTAPKSDSLDSFIRRRARDMLDRPKMYADSPETMESMLCLLDEILGCHGTTCSTTGELRSFTDYSVDRGFGSASYCGRMRLDNSHSCDDEIWEGLIAAWKEYLDISHFREDA